jgi:cytochrome P450
MLELCDTTANAIADGWCLVPEHPAALDDLLTHREIVPQAVGKIVRLRPHLAFGRGTNFCLGGSLARRESRLALDGLLDTCAHPELAEVPVQRASPWAFGYEKVHLRAPN